MIAGSSFDTGGWEVALGCLLALWFVAGLGYLRESRGLRRGERMARWRIAVLGMPALIVLAIVRLVIRQ